ncbi:MAG: hypothetical protein HN356_12850 [Calditrichaeota bacterium]|nr:hypothetical protein [Calditrichota bacterium]
MRPISKLVRTSGIAFILLTLITLAFLKISHAGNGDTLIVQTFCFDSISTRRATFGFPTEDRTWSKVLMYYTLKCDTATTGDKYPCGEWDTSTHTYIYRHTGNYDSTMHQQPLFKVNGESPETFFYSDEPRYYYYTDWIKADGKTPNRNGMDDFYLKFEGRDYIEVPTAAVQDLDSAFTISMWVKGDAAKQPQNDQLLEAADRGGRVLNIHLPWGSGQVYFDAGGRLGGNNNRLTKSADKGEYLGRWNHWAFTKDVRTGVQKIYLNGELWHEAGNMFKSIRDIDRFIIGANANANGGFYAGSLDDIRIWNIALSEEIIKEWQFRDINKSHPFYGNLKVNYTFDNITDAAVMDSSPNAFHAESFGQPQLLKYELTGSSDYKPGPNSVLQADSTIAPKVTVEFFEDEDNPKQLTSTKDFWPAYDLYFDRNGNLLDEVVLENPEVIENDSYEYYSEPFEIVERFELGRFITPYGKGLKLGQCGFTWVYDVSDYVHFLKGEVDLQAANNFELLDLKFVFIEGSPPRDVLSVENIWKGKSYNYGALADNKDLKAKLVGLNPDAAGHKVRSRISGHGHFGPRNCAEWDAKEHYLHINGVSRFNWTVWKDCGMNPVYPQGGTWQFDRAGWCPGTWVDTYDHEITRYVQNSTEVILDYDIEPYDPEIGEAGASYLVEHQLITYGAPNFKRDAAIKDIIAPNDRCEYRRQNPISGNAVFELENLGYQTLESLKITYGLEGNEQSTFHWKGSLEFLKSETVTLPAADWSGMDEHSKFVVHASKPNSRKDQNKFNDRMITKVREPHILPMEFIVYLETPGFGRAIENSFVIIDENEKVVTERSGFEDDSTYQEQIKLTPGAYEFTFSDTNEDGMIRHWWLRGSDPERIGKNGLLQIRDLEGEVLVDLGYDFAEKEVVRFFVGKP